MFFSFKQDCDCSKIAIVIITFASVKGTVKLFEGFVKQRQESSAWLEKSQFLVAQSYQLFESSLGSNAGICLFRWFWDFW